MGEATVQKIRSLLFPADFADNRRFFMNFCSNQQNQREVYKNGEIQDGLFGKRLSFLI